MTIIPDPANRAGPSPKPDTVRIQIMEIPALIRTLMAVSMPGDYRTARALTFKPFHFTRTFLNPEEFQRLNRFKALKKQVEWVCGRYCAKSLARRVLGSGTDPLQGPDPFQKLDRIEIGYMNQGAPYLLEFPANSLSLSHSGRYTAAALSTAPGTIVGIDIEAVGPRPDAHFMKTAFTAREIPAMGDDPRAVFRCWTLKEAYLKYIRMGFNESLHRVEIIGNSIFHHGREQHLTCRSLDLDRGYIMGIVSEPGTAIDFFDPDPL